MPAGIYISVPFCRSKCTFCNFASGVVSRNVYARYVERLCGDIERGKRVVGELGAAWISQADSIYLGGGTPTVLDEQSLEDIFAAVRQQFVVAPDAEITVECAPGTLSPEKIEALVRCGVNRVSLGVQSFVDMESASIGRLHTRATVLQDLARLREAGITNISIDLIAGLPHQTRQSWRYSLDETIASAIPHISVYMLEVDEDSRLGKELLAGGTRYHAHFVPDDDAVADFYLEACEILEAAGVRQYEISNFARDTADPGNDGAPEQHQVMNARHGGTGEPFPAWHSRHNLKYWTRQPYFGFGVDAHSMLPAQYAASELESIRFSTASTLDEYMAGASHSVASVSRAQALEEAWFLGLRLNVGMRPADASALFGDSAAAVHGAAVAELKGEGLLDERQGALRLTPRGRLLSNEVFERFLVHPARATG